MEKNNQIKERFYSLYIGCDLFGNSLTKSNKLTFSNINSVVNNSNVPLCLKPLSGISDEQAIQLAKICDFVSFPDEYIVVACENYISVNHKYNDYQDQFDCFRIYNDFQLLSIDEEGRTFEYDAERICECIDYLRLESIAIPFMGATVEKLVEYNWVKLKE